MTSRSEFQLDVDGRPRGLHRGMRAGQRPTHEPQRVFGLMEQRHDATDVYQLLPQRRECHTWFHNHLRSFASSYTVSVCNQMQKCGIKDVTLLDVTLLGSDHLVQSRGNK